MKRVAISQSNYLPWKGYFDTIAAVDEFVLYDRMQYTRRDWRNRNKIKTRQGAQWITVPVRVKGRYLQTIDETELDGSAFIDEHLNAIRHNYARTPAFGEVFPWLSDLLRSAPTTTISALNRHLLQAICVRLAIPTKIRESAEFELAEDRNERLLRICEALGADEYVSGPAARSYMDESVFRDRGVRVRWKSYEGYPAYDQPYPPFEHAVSIVDTLFCTGAEARRYVHSARPFDGA